MTKEQILDGVYLNWYDGWMGKEDDYIFYPRKEATMHFHLEESEELCTIADAYRKSIDNSLEPLSELSMEKFVYDFFIGVNEIDGEPYVDDELEFVVTLENASDFEGNYFIKLSEQERRWMQERLTALVRGRNCRTLKEVVEAAKYVLEES